MMLVPKGQGIKQEQKGNSPIPFIKCIPQRPQTKTQKQYGCDVMSPLTWNLQRILHSNKLYYAMKTAYHCDELQRKYFFIGTTAAIIARWHD